jgi:ABC-type antimicrobial peptide transport system ATPase subunit
MRKVHSLENENPNKILYNDKNILSSTGLYISRFQWQVLDWNQKAIDLYHKIGAKPLKEWITYRMDALAIDKFLNS